jgi:hypothetical protein
VEQYPAGPREPGLALLLRMGPNGLDMTIPDKDDNKRQYILEIIQCLPQNENHKLTFKRRVLHMALGEVIFIRCLSNLSSTNDRKKIIKFDEIKEIQNTDNFIGCTIYRS